MFQRKALPLFPQCGAYARTCVPEGGSSFGRKPPVRGKILDELLLPFSLTPAFESADFALPERKNIQIWESFRTFPYFCGRIEANSFQDI